MRGMRGWAGILFAALIAPACATAADEDASGRPSVPGPVHARILRVGPGGRVDGVHLAADGHGNTVIAGAFAGTIDLGGPAPLVSKGERTDVFVAAYDGAGRLLWQQRFGGAANDHVSGLAVGGGGTIYLTGSLIAGTAADLGGLPPPCGASGVGLLALDSSGRPRWAVDVRTSSDPGHLGPVAADAEDNALVIGGCEFCGRVDLAGGHLDRAGHAFLARIAPDGRARFLRALDTNADAELTSLAAAPDGAALVTVTGKRTGFGDVSVRGAGDTDGFVVKVGPEGDLAWVRRFGGRAEDRADQVVVDRRGTAFLTGSVGGDTLLGGAVVPESHFWATLGEDGRIDRVHPIAAHLRLATNGDEVVVAGVSSGPAPAETTPLPERTSSAYVAWLDAKGEVRRERRLVGGETLRLDALSVDTRGQAVIAGFFTGGLRLGGSSTLEAGPGTAVFVAAFAP